MQRDWHDIAGGLALTATGLAVAAYAAGHYEFGTLRRMGPGFFPVVLGLMLALLGAVIALPGFAREGKPGRIAIRELIAVLASIAAFALLLYRAGLVPATMVSVLISSLAAPRGGVLWRIVLAAIVAALTVLIFSVLLRMTLPLWPVM
ncbi:MAG: tripartite tricarboxylate transporter TctB family protein [Paracoccus sp. (in: a-proteobacteria)]|nr:tripartite tricarboxylate transporter TctB family protein [Paracoccus sp. (in: a-proteobacteria)]